MLKDIAKYIASFLEANGRAIRRSSESARRFLAFVRLNRIRAKRFLFTHITVVSSVFLVSAATYLFFFPSVLPRNCYPLAHTTPGGEPVKTGTARSCEPGRLLALEWTSSRPGASGGGSYLLNEGSSDEKQRWNERYIEYPESSHGWQLQTRVANENFPKSGCSGKLEVTKTGMRFRTVEPRAMMRQPSTEDPEKLKEFKERRKECNEANFRDKDFQHCAWGHFELFIAVPRDLCAPGNVIEYYRGKRTIQGGIPVCIRGVGLDGSYRADWRWGQLGTLGAAWCE